MQSYITASPDEVVAGPLETEEWIDFVDFGMQVWFSNQSMIFHEAITYCNNLNGILFEPYDQNMFEDILDGARRADLELAWIGVTDFDEEGV